MNAEPSPTPKPSSQSQNHQHSAAGPASGDSFQPAVAPDADQPAVSSSNAQVNLAAVHSNLSEKCPRCQCVIQQPVSLGLHSYTHHLEHYTYVGYGPNDQTYGVRVTRKHPLGPVHCPVNGCPEEYLSSADLRRHILVHGFTNVSLQKIPLQELMLQEPHILTWDQLPSASPLRPPPVLITPEEEDVGIPLAHQVTLLHSAVLGGPARSSPPSIMNSPTPENSPPALHQNPCELFEPQELKSFGLAIHPGHRILICLACETGISADTAITHGKHSQTPMSLQDRDNITQILSEYRFSTPDNISLPNHGPPIAGIKYTLGYRCPECPFAAPAYGTLEMHWNSENRHETAVSAREAIVRAHVQTVFRFRPSYFVVNPSLTGVSPEDPFHLFMTQLAPRLEPQPITAPATHVRETPPHVQFFGWDLLLKTAITTRTNVAALRALVHKPANGNNPLFRLVDVVLTYLKQIRALNESAGFLDKTYFTTHRDDDTLKTYSTVLWQLVQMTSSQTELITFNLTPEDLTRQQHLVRNLNEATTAQSVLSLHEYILPLLSPGGKTPQRPHSVLEQFAAIYCLKEDGLFLPPERCTQLFAIIKYLCRSVCLFQAGQTRENFDNDLLKSVESSTLLMLSLNQDSPFTMARSAAIYLAPLATSGWRAPTMRVSDDHMTYTYREHSIHIDQWRTGLQNAFSDFTVGLLALAPGQTITLNTNVPVIDDWANLQRGYTFLRNSPFEVPPHALLQALSHNPDLSPLRVDPAGRLEFHTPTVLRLLKACAELNQLLAFLLFTIPGQDPRAAEFTDHKISNSTRPRTLFMTGTELWTAVRRVKSENLMGRETFIPTWITPVLSKWILYYLTVVRPLERVLVHVQYGSKVTQLMDEYLFVQHNQRMTDEVFRTIFPQLMHKYCHVSLGIHDYRQVVVEISRLFLGTEQHRAEEAFDAFAAQRGHTLQTSRTHYAPEFGQLSGMSSDQLLRFKSASSDWTTVTGFHPTLPQLVPIIARHALALRAQTLSDASGGHHLNSAQVVELVRSLMNEQLVTVVAKMQETIRPAVAGALLEYGGARQYHPPLGPALAHTNISQHNDDGPPPHEDISAPLQLKGHPMSPGTEVLTIATQLLDQMFPHQTNQFKSDAQCQAVQQAILGTHSFTAILPTGGGKSMIWKLPALLNRDDTTIVIIPNAGLLQDQISSTARASIKCCQWTASDSTKLSNERIVYMAVESTKSPKFIQLVQENQTRIVRLVFDEAHNIVTQKHFRAIFKGVHALADLPIQRIYLTASLPRRLRRIFLEETALSPTAPIFSTPVSQPQLSYHVFYLPSNSSLHLARVAAELGRHVDHNYLGSNGQGMIFACSKAMVKDVHGFMTEDGRAAAIYHGDLTPADKASQFDAWRNGSTRWMVATTSLVQGIDRPHIRVLIFVEMPYGIVNLFQGGGRGGRDDELAYVIVLTTSNTQKPPPVQSPIELEKDRDGTYEGKLWLTNRNQCRRIGFSKLFDSASTACSSDPHNQMCDVCQKQSPFHIDIQNLINTVLDNPASFSNAIASTSAVQNPSSTILHNPGTPMNAIASTSALQPLPSSDDGLWGQLEDVNQTQAFYDFRRNLVLPKYKYCWYCGFPQQDTRNWGNNNYSPPNHPKFEGGPIECPFTNFVAAAIWWIFIQSEVMEQAIAEIGHELAIPDPLTPEKFITWCAAEQGPHHFYNGLELLIWYWKKPKPSE
ncbi:hypothetical protein C8J56DRAFT_1076612 [Mycena floridula]|nr:hypothetical protein C8J56DRAFT_1076612 [Mycena floridula]